MRSAPALILLAASVLAAGCGPDAATAAAATARVNATQAAQAKAQQDQLQQKLDGALRATDAAASAASDI